MSDTNYDRSIIEKNHLNKVGVLSLVLVSGSFIGLVATSFFVLVFESIDYKGIIAQFITVLLLLFVFVFALAVVLNGLLGKIKFYPPAPGGFFADRAVLLSSHMEAKAVVIVVGAIMIYISDKIGEAVAILGFLVLSIGFIWIAYPAFIGYMQRYKSNEFLRYKLTRSVYDLCVETEDYSIIKDVFNHSIYKELLRDSSDPETKEILNNMLVYSFEGQNPPSNKMIALLLLSDINRGATLHGQAAPAYNETGAERFWTDWLELESRIASKSKASDTK